MKKTVALTLIILMILPLPAFAYTKTDNIVYVDYYYSYGSDEYIINYYYDDFYTGEATSMKFVFVATINGVTYTRYWLSSAVNKTIYVNCNGTGSFYIRRFSVDVASFEGLTFSQIQDERCSVRIPGTSDNDLNLSAGAGNGTNGAGYGQNRIDYTKIPDGNSYQLQRSDDTGSTWTTVDTNNSSDNNFFVVGDPGLYRLNVTDTDGNLIGRDVIGEKEFSKECINGCSFIDQILDCPGWDEILGDFSDSLAEIIPTPSDFSDSMIEKLSEQDVAPDDPVVPEPFDPGYPEQQTDLPAPVTTDINPAPSDFEPETGGDGSGAFNVTDPAEWTPDDNDKTGGYVPPNPDADSPPDYSEPGGDDEAPPNYQPPGGAGDTPPNYTPPGGAGDEIPDYETPGGTGETIPGYNGGGGTSNDVPAYDYN